MGTKDDLRSSIRNVARMGNEAFQEARRSLIRSASAAEDKENIIKAAGNLYAARAFTVEGIKALHDSVQEALHDISYHAKTFAHDAYVFAPCEEMLAAYDCTFETSRGVKILHSLTHSPPAFAVESLKKQAAEYVALYGSKALEKRYPTGVRFCDIREIVSIYRTTNGERLPKVMNGDCFLLY